jgi:gliding motility-associated-like protein
MWGGIGTNLRIFLIAATLSCISHFSFCQFYIGGKKCISVPATPPGPSGPAPSADCNEPTIFFDERPDATAWVWNFGDGSAPASTRNPQHTYAAVGTYTVTLTRTIGAVVQTPVTKTVTISEPPTQPMFFKKISADTTVCDGKKVKLDPYKDSAPPAGVTYLWFPKGQTTPTIDVDSAGCYSVEVFDPSGQCSRIAKINVKFCLQQSNSGGGEKWYFGKGATLEFGLNPASVVPPDTLANTGDLFEDPDQEDPTYIPVQPSKSNPVDSPEGVAMVYGPSGSLVFYTDGVKIYRGSDDQPMVFIPPAGSDLGGTNTSTQSSLIIPKNSCNECPHHLYYVYTLNETTGMLSYSIVDMRRDDGKGAVVETNIPVSFTTTQQIATRKALDDSGNEIGFYIYSHDSKTNEFRILKVDSTGTTEKVQPLGMIPSDTTGYMRISPTGDQLAMAIVKNGQNFIEVYNINPENGDLTLTYTIDLKTKAPPMVYGLEFSQDGEKLYTTLRGDPANNVKSYLYQLNLNLKDAVAINAQKIKIDESATNAFGALQMGPTNVNGGGAIYMAVDGSVLIPYISQPEVVGNASLVGYVPINNGFGADVIGESHFGFPNVVHAKAKPEGEGLSATFEGTCQGQPTKFTTQGICSPMKNQVAWEFGDGATGSGTEVSHVYEKEGRYIIKMTVDVFSETFLSQNVNVPILGNALKQKCNTFVVTDTVYIKPTPVINLPDSAFVCVLRGATLILDPKVQRAYDPQYLWRPTSETTPTITVSALATYSVRVANKFISLSSGPLFCATADTVIVKEGCEPQLFVPEIFTPNGDGLNDRFELPSEFITDFDLKIYNRWGEIIFESFETDTLWDGTYKGKMMAPMLYAFVVSYKSQYFPYRPKITKTGGILLVK